MPAWDSSVTSRGNVLSTELNSLADNSRTNQGTEYDNTTNLDRWGWLEIQVTFGSAPSDTNPYLKISMVHALDGTNYADGSSSIDPGDDTFVVSVPVRAVTTAQNKQVGPISIPPAKVKFILENQTGQSFPASGSTVELFTA